MFKRLFEHNGLSITLQMTYNICTYIYIYNMIYILNNIIDNSIVMNIIFLCFNHITIMMYNWTFPNINFNSEL